MGWLEETHRQSKPVRAVAYDARKRRRDSTKSFATEREARDWITFREEQIANLYRDAGGEYHHRSLQQSPTLAEYGRARVPQVPTWSKATRKERVDALNTEIRRYFGEQIRVNEVTKADIQGMLVAARDRGCGPSGQAEKLRVFRRIMEDAIDDGLRDNNPTRGIKTRPVPKKQPVSLTDAEITAIVEQLPDWLQAAVWVSADAGLRISEVCGLQIEQVDLLHRKLWVKHVIDVDGSLRDYPKGREVLPVVMTDRVHAALQRHLDHHYKPRSNYVFTLPNGKRLLPKGIRYRFYPAFDRTGIQKRRPHWHDLRHHTANKLAQAGTPAYIIQAVLRHKNLSTSQRYIDTVSDGDQRQWVNRAFNVC